MEKLRDKVYPSDQVVFDFATNELGKRLSKLPDVVLTDAQMISVGAIPPTEKSDDQM